MAKRVARIKKNCEVCGELFEVLPSRAKKRYCSKSCAAKVSRKHNGNVEVVCQQCSMSFHVPPSRKNAKFCSKRCYGNSKKGKPSSSKGKKIHTGVVLECEQCHKLFRVPYARRNKARFCTKKCANLWFTGRTRPEMKRQVEVTCEQCGKTFSINAAQTERRFCTKKCRGQWLGKLQTGEGHPNWSRVDRICETCGKSFQITSGELAKGEHRGAKYGRFCSKACQSFWQAEARTGENSGAWKGGLSFLSYPPEFNDLLKRQVWERDQGLCLCGSPGVDVHHIDYDKNNNDLINLLLLCKSCHGKTNAHRETWTPLFQWHNGEKVCLIQMNMQQELTIQRSTNEFAG